MRRGPAQHSTPKTHNEYHGDNQQADMFIYKINDLKEKITHCLRLFCIRFGAPPDREIFQ